VTTTDLRDQEETRPLTAACRRDLVTFVVLAYALSWGWLIPWAATGHTVREGVGWPTHFPSLLGPMVAAMAVTAWRSGRPGLRRLAQGMVRWRIGWRWWIVATSPLLAVLLLWPVLMALGLAPAAGDLRRYNGLPVLNVVWVLLLVIVVNGLGEETGWRGYLLPRLETRLGPLRATVVVSLVWAGWHIPQFFYLHSLRGFSPLMIPVWGYGLFCGAVIMTWLFNRTGGSILAVAVFHGTYNLSNGTLAASAHSGLLSIVTWVLVVGFAIVLLRAERRAQGEGRTVLGRDPAASLAAR
jgi:membrane protease YdiL (CAAX protease family)